MPLNKRRRAVFYIANVELSILERNALDEIKRRLAIGSDGDIVRVALFNLAKHVELKWNHEKLFHLRHAASTSVHPGKEKPEPPFYRSARDWKRPHRTDNWVGQSQDKVRRHAHERIRHTVSFPEGSETVHRTPDAPEGGPDQRPETASELPPDRQRDDDR